MAAWLRQQILILKVIKVAICLIAPASCRKSDEVARQSRTTEPEDSVRPNRSIELLKKKSSFLGGSKTWSKTRLLRQKEWNKTGTVQQDSQLIEALFNQNDAKTRVCVGKAIRKDHCCKTRKPSESSKWTFCVYVIFGSSQTTRP